ncbi:Hypothetical protein CINCED_3A022300 [Cinara cedri]|nr:Hypothetical protein CINCED_3A022300 [Cinara cedri]
MRFDAIEDDVRTVLKIGSSGSLGGDPLNSRGEGEGEKENDVHNEGKDTQRINIRHKSNIFLCGQGEINNKFLVHTEY